MNLKIIIIIMKAKKVNEMIDPYTSEEDAMDLDVSYKNKVIRKGIEDWFMMYAPDTSYTIDEDLNIFVNNRLDLFKTKAKSLPENLTINGTLIIAYSSIEILPKTLKVLGMIEASYSKIRKLEEGIKIYGSLYLDNCKITSLPDNLTIGSQDRVASLILRNNPINHLPKNLNVTHTLDIRSTNIDIDNLPKDLKVRLKIITGIYKP